MLDADTHVLILPVWGRAQDSAFLKGGRQKAGFTCICKGLLWTLCLHQLRKLDLAPEAECKGKGRVTSRM